MCTTTPAVIGHRAVGANADFQHLMQIWQNFLPPSRSAIDQLYLSWVFVCGGVCSR